MKISDNFVAHKVKVELGSRSYDILIGLGSLSDCHKHIKRLFSSGSLFMISDDNCFDLIGHDLIRLLAENGLSVRSVVFPMGEGSKNLRTVENISSELAQKGADRHSVIIALGGGVTGDIAGFVASIYMRGIPFVQIPTTLLAQVDSSVGGKTGVDLKEGKNLVGTFYQPSLVIIDIGVLATLPPKELRNGLSEVIKYGAIWDADFFSYLEDNIKGCIGLEPEAIMEVVRRSCEIKAEVVSSDEREAGLRRILNFGHTFGHAIEAASNFQISHGEGVSIGMVAASRLSNMKGLLSDNELERMINLITAMGLPVELPSYLNIDDVISRIKYDKKSRGGDIHFVLLKRIGDTLITPDVSNNEIKTALSKGNL